MGQRAPLPTGFKPTRVRLKLLTDTTARTLDSRFKPTRVRLKPSNSISTSSGLPSLQTRKGSPETLYLVSLLTDGFGGRVWIEDNEPRGAVFVVELPKAGTNRETGVAVQSESQAAPRLTAWQNQRKPDGFIVATKDVARRVR